VKARSGTNNGTFTIQGMGNVDTSQTGGSGGNAIDFSNLAGATSAVININTGGALTGVARGISVTQNGSGNIAITPSGNVTGNGGNAIFAQNNGASGNITVDPTATVTTSGSNAAAIFAQVNGGSGNITIDPTGTVTANAGSGISAQEIGGTGNITIGASGTVTGNAGTGIFALNTGATGNILINGTGNVTGSGSSTANGIGAQFTNANNAANVFNNGTITVTQSGNISGAQDGIDVADANFINTVAQAAGSGTISVTAGNTAGNAVLTGSSRYGIGAFTGGTGSITVETLAGTTINSGASGIIPVNQAPASVDFTGANSTITVTARGTINSGSNNNANGSEPAGIDAGYLAATGSNVFGNVTVDNFATITAAKGGGILAFMNGTGSGDVRVTDEAGSTITALNSATNVTTGASNPVGIKATSNGTGSITVITSASDGTHAGSIIDSGGSGIIAKNQSTSIPASAHSTISVTAAGSIEFGTILNNNGTKAAGINAGYGGGSNDTPNTSVYGDVSIDSAANITLANSTAGSGDGIRASNYGVGGITITDERSTVIQANSGYRLEYGIDAENYESGSPTSGVAIAITTSTGDDINTGSGGGTGIRALDLATTTPTASTITVTANGTIESGTAADAKFTGVPAAGILAGYLGVNGISSTTPAANANVLGSVTVHNHATVTAAAGYGIAALDYASGNVSVDNSATVTGPVGLYALSILNNNVSTTITIDNTGTIYSDGNATDAALAISQSSAGTATITNEAGALIAHTSLSASSLAVSSTGGGSVELDNFGTIDGYLSLDATFTNKSTGIWNVAGTNSFGDGSTINNAGTINASGGASLTTGGTLTVTNSGGTIDVLSGTLTLSGQTITITGGTLTNSGARWRRVAEPTRSRTRPRSPIPARWRRPAPQPC